MPSVEEKKDKKDQEEGGEETRQVDPRVQWFEDIVVKNLRIKNDKFKKLLVMPDSWSV
jgi:hypothetical protein